jgi:membrane fusion protein (multidrug efflux system)
MDVTVDTHKRNGSRLAANGSRDHGGRTDVFAGELALADSVVDKIVQANQ